MGIRKIGDGLGYERIAPTHMAYPWSQERIGNAYVRGQVAGLWQHGFDTNDIAAKLDIPEWAVYNILHELRS